MKRPIPDAISIELAAKKLRRSHPTNDCTNDTIADVMLIRGEGWEPFLLSAGPTFREEQHDVEANRPGCACARCKPLEYTRGSGYRCEQEMRKLIHIEDTATLIQSQPCEVATIIVGPEKTKFTCHRALLCYHSEFFDAALHWGEKAEVVIVIEEDEVDEVSAFVAWCYSGQLNTEIRSEYLWLFADKIRSQRFANEAMNAILWAYHYERPSMEYVIKMYELSVPGSKLRLLVRDSLLADGPLTRDAEQTASEIEWRTAVKTGGEGIDDVLSEVMLEGSLFQHKAKKEQPQYYMNHWKYLEKIQTRSLEDIMNGVPRSGYENTGREVNGGKVQGLEGEVQGGEVKGGDVKGGGLKEGEGHKREAFQGGSHGGEK